MTESTEERTTVGTETKPDKTKLAEIRAKLDAIAPLPETGDVTAMQLARHMAVRAQERWTRMLAAAGTGVDHLQLSAMLAEFATAHALGALFEAGPKAADWCAVQIRDAMEDGGAVGEWLWELLGEETSREVAALAEELAAAVQAEAVA
jgi:hypothetical protein